MHNNVVKANKNNDQALIVDSHLLFSYSTVSDEAKEEAEEEKKEKKQKEHANQYVDFSQSFFIQTKWMTMICAMRPPNMILTQSQLTNQWLTR